MKIYRTDNKITHITFSLLGNWISFDRSGVMTWDNITKRNHFWIYSARNGKAF